MEDTAKWYIIHTYSGYESMVKDSLEKLIENNNLQDTILEIKIPTEETLEEKANGKKKIVVRRLFPCYVFLKMRYTNSVWYMITNTRGVTGFVGPQGWPLPISDDEVQRIGLGAGADVEFNEGDDVQIVNGPLDSFTGKIISVTPSAKKAMVKVSMFGRVMDVEVEYSQIKKVKVETETPDPAEEK